MSHVVTSPIIITNLEAFKRALKKFPKLNFIEGAKRYHWYGRWMQDYSQADAAYKLGIAPDQYGKCDHKLHMDGVTYEAGLTKRKDGKGWSLVWDFFSDGHRISDYIGQGAEHLVTEYNRQVMLMQAEALEAQGSNTEVYQHETDDELLVEITVNA